MNHTEDTPTCGIGNEGGTCFQWFSLSTQILQHVFAYKLVVELLLVVGEWRLMHKGKSRNYTQPLLQLSISVFISFGFSITSHWVRATHKEIICYFIKLILLMRMRKLRVLCQDTKQLCKIGIQTKYTQCEHNLNRSISDQNLLVCH